MRAHQTRVNGSSSLANYPVEKVRLISAVSNVISILNAVRDYRTRNMELLDLILIDGDIYRRYHRPKTNLCEGNIFLTSDGVCVKPPARPRSKLFQIMNHTIH